MRPTFHPILIALVILLALLPAGASASAATDAYEQGAALLAAGNYTEAGLAFAQAVSLDPSLAEAWNGEASVLNQEGKFSDALEASNRSIALNASSAAAWINRGQILYNIGFVYEDQLHDTTTAATYYAAQLAAFENATRLEPENPEAWFNKAYALCGMGRCSEGLEDFHRVEALDPEYPHLQGNIQNAEKLAEAQQPAYTKYVIPAAVIGIIAVIAGYWLLVVRKRSGAKPSEPAKVPTRKGARKKKEE